MVIVNDEIYEGDETFNVVVKSPAGPPSPLFRYRLADGTFCTTLCCARVPYPVTITDEGDLPALALGAAPASIDEEDDTSTTGTAENVSTVTASIGNAKTFATDQVVTLTFSGTATYGTHYAVTPTDADTNATGHQVTLPAGDSSVDVKVTATANDSADGDHEITVVGTRGGEAFGSSVTIVIASRCATTTTPTCRRRARRRLRGRRRSARR